MAKKKEISALELIENWGLDFHTGKAIEAIYKASKAQDANEEFDAVSEATKSLVNKLESSNREKKRLQWRKQQKKSRAKKATQPPQG